jgi:Zn-finger nucleic acid-binding protein
MPLLLCPNDNASMTTVQRSGVSFDMCPTCRGVWLDRGEMEKLLEAERASGGGGPQEDYRPQREERRPEHRPPERYRDDDDHKYRGGYRKRSSIFDIFD